MSLESLLLPLAAAVVVVGALARWRIPTTLGYLALGVLIGPHALGWLPDGEATQLLAELGVVFLMFVVGLEFSMPALLAARWTVLGLGGLEVALIGGAAAAVGYWAGVPPTAALLLGAALAMSSTAIVLKQLHDRNEVHSRHGRLCVAILIFQDLITLPLLAILPELGGDGGVRSVLQALGTTLAAFLALGWLGRRIIRPLFRWIAAQRSTELFTLNVLLTVVGAAGAAEWAGLSPPLGAFLAGLVLGETEYRHQIESDVHPFQSVLLGLFFASIGMLLDPRALWANGPVILSALSAYVVFKGLGITLLIRLTGQDTGVALRSGLILGHGGEFGLLLISVALSHALLPVETAQVTLALIVGTMLLAPVAVQFSGSIAEALSKGYRARDREAMQRIEAMARSARHHVVVCGFGRTGQNIAEILHRRGHDYVALDLDPERVSEAQAANITVVYGDATRRAVLKAAGAKRARAVVVTVSLPQVAVRIVTQARSLDPDLAILVRTRDDAHFDALKAAGASDVLPEGLEASLMLGAQLLDLLGDSEEAIGHTLGAIRADQYLSLRRFYHGSDAATEGEVYSGERRAVVLSPVGRHFRLGELLQHFPEVQVTGVVRSGVRSDLPPPDSSVRPGDVLELCGSRDELDHITDYLAGGFDVPGQGARKT